MRKLLIAVLLLHIVHIGIAQTKELPKIFINCQQTRCYTDYIKIELPAFTFVRDLDQSDVNVLITSNGNASGGRTYQLYFSSKTRPQIKKDTISFFVRQDDTEDIARKKLLNTISYGLLPYLKGTELEQNTKISFAKIKPAAIVEENDQWNRWIFGLGANGRLEGESNRKEVRLDANVRGGQTTEKSKFSFYTYFSQKSNAVTVDSVLNTVKTNNYGFNSLYVRSFSDHWSLGGFMKGYHSVYQNIKFSKSIAPALEFSVFPVKDFNSKQLRWIYQAGVLDLDYIETTIYDKIEETLPYQQVTGILGFTQPWGNFSAELSGFQYLHDLERYRLSLELDLSLRVAQGLSVRFYGNGSQINNQISLAKSSGDASSVLLGGRQLATTFSFNTSFGLNYTFGSLNNSIVNPRFSGVN